MKTTVSQPLLASQHDVTHLPSCESVDDQQRSVASHTNQVPDSLFFHLRCHAFYLGLAIRDWDRELTWMNLHLMAPLLGLDACDYPYKKPDMERLCFQFGFLINAIEASDLGSVRSMLAEMLRAAYLA